MSNQNNHPIKRLRRNSRYARKMSAAKNIPFGGVRVTRGDVLRHRYLERCGEPYSRTVASVYLPTRQYTATERAMKMA